MHYRMVLDTSANALPSCTSRWVWLREELDLFYALLKKVSKTNASLRQCALLDYICFSSYPVRNQCKSSFQEHSNKPRLTLLEFCVRFYRWSIFVCPALTTDLAEKISFLRLPITCMRSFLKRIRRNDMPLCWLVTLWPETKHNHGELL